MRKLGIYIHIPFCVKKCKYCDFVSFPGSEEKQNQYVKALIKEIQIRDFKNLGERKINSIYIGGGTPSCITSAAILEILEAIYQKYSVDENAEITIEVNPGTVSHAKLLDYKKAGINRISIGLQSTQNRLLDLLGRIHTYEDFLEVYQLVKAVGFENINVDLMLAIPTQTQKELLESLQKIIDLKPTHISLYSLILEEHTELERLVAKGILELIDDEIERKMYWNTKKLLEKNGYMQYEISNFAKKGFASKHNLDCWYQEEYLGYGLAAHSYFDKKRFSNTNNLEKYIENIESSKLEQNIEIHEIQSEEDEEKEYMLLRLRTIKGVSITEFEKKFHTSPLLCFQFALEKLVQEGLIVIDLDTIALTEKGIDFANLVFQEFI